MATILKCKMCGGDIEVSQDMTVGKCLFCGSTMTLPRIDSEKKARLFNRANEYRLNNEFDKAYDAYKTITEEDEQEAEAYWGMILSEYGVEYVEDPVSGKRVPTCHRTQMQSILDNTNYKLALQYSAGESKFIYQDEAEELDKIQRKIISVSSRIEPYDVFICYKESEDASGERTQDSVLAESIYNELEKQGVRAFFSRISLEEHLGENYEPYIYAALKSARVMLVVSTESSHCEAVWVKNEWARFLHFMEEDDSKVLIAVYQDMNAYDFPNALSKFQMQDMSKIGAINDLSRGIKRILGTTITESRDTNINKLLAAEEKRRDREERGRKRNKIILLMGISVLAITLIAFIIIFTYPRIRNSYYTNLLEKETITLSDTIPDSNEYLGLEVELNKDSFKDCFEFVTGDRDSLYLKSKLYEKGWIYISSSGCYYTFNKTTFWKLSFEYQEEYSMDLLPLSTAPNLAAPASIIFNNGEKPIKLFFVSERMVKEYEIQQKGGIYTRHLELQDGRIIDSEIGDSSKRPISVLKNYKY